jgi:hypothetical protein
MLFGIDWIMFNLKRIKWFKLFPVGARIYLHYDLFKLPVSLSQFVLSVVAL